MKRRKRFTIKLVALGLAAAAFSAAPAQARLDEGLGMSKQSEPVLVVSPDDRNISLMSPQTEPNVVVSPDDRAIRRSEVSPAPSAISSDDGFELGTLGMSGLVLLLGAAGAFTIAYYARAGRVAGA